MATRGVEPRIGLAICDLSLARMQLQLYSVATFSNFEPGSSRNQDWCVITRDMSVTIDAAAAPRRSMTLLDDLSNLVHAQETHRKQRRKALAGWWVWDAHVELDHLKERRGEHSWQVKVVSFLHRHRVQSFFLALLILDVLVIFVELFVDAEFPRCDLIVRDATSCCAAADAHAHGSGGEHRRLAAASVCAAPYHAVGAPAGCDVHRHDFIHQLHDGLFGASVAILGAFCVFTPMGGRTGARRRVAAARRPRDRRPTPPHPPSQARSPSSSSPCSPRSTLGFFVTRSTSSISPSSRRRSGAPHLFFTPFFHTSFHTSHPARHLLVAQPRGGAARDRRRRALRRAHPREALAVRSRRARRRHLDARGRARRARRSDARGDREAEGEDRRARGTRRSTASLKLTSPGS